MSACTCLVRACVLPVWLVPWLCFSFLFRSFSVFVLFSLCMCVCVCAHPVMPLLPFCHVPPSVVWPDPAPALLHIPPPPLRDALLCLLCEKRQTYGCALACCSPSHLSSPLFSLSSFFSSLTFSSRLLFSVLCVSCCFPFACGMSPRLHPPPRAHTAILAG